MVAQSVEQRTENPCVVGSIPTRGTILIDKFRRTIYNFKMTIVRLRNYGTLAQLVEQ